MSTENFMEIPSKVWDDFYKYNKLTWKKLHIKIQCYASKFALNNCIEDMNEIQKNGVLCATMTIRTNPYCETSDPYYYYDLSIINREDMRDIRRRDYTMSQNVWCSHLFYEIPIVRQFTEHQVDKWQNFMFRKLVELAVANKKKAQQWLVMKKANEDFE